MGVVVPLREVKVAVSLQDADDVERGIKRETVESCSTIDVTSGVAGDVDSLRAKS